MTATDTSNWVYLATLIHNSPDVIAAVVQANRQPEAYFAQHEDELFDRGVEEPSEVTPLLAFIIALDRAQALAYLDWEFSHDDFIWNLQRLDRIATAKIDLEELRAVDNQAEILLPAADLLLQRHDLRLLHLDEGGDSYPLIVVPDKSAAEIITIATSLGQEIHRLTPPTSTTAPEPEPELAVAPIPAFSEQQQEAVAQWLGHFVRGNQWSMAPERETVRRKLRNNTIAMAVAISLAVATVALTVGVAVFDLGRWPTYVLLAVFLVLLGLGIRRIRKLRAGLRAAVETDGEYLGITREGVRLVGTLIPWAEVCGGLVADERGSAEFDRKRRLAGVMSAIGYSRVEIHLGAWAGMADSIRDRAHSSARRLYSSFMGNGGVRIPLEWALPQERIGAAILGIRVSAALAGVRLIAAAETQLVYATLSNIWQGKEPADPAVGEGASRPIGITPRTRYGVTVDGNDLPLKRDGDTWLVVSSTPTRPGPQWRHYRGHIVRDASGAELEQAFRLVYRGTYQGVPVGAEPLPNGRFMLFASGTREAFDAGMLHSNKGEASLEVDAGVPGLQLTQERRPAGLRRPE